jgi:hypothetical protein
VFLFLQEEKYKTTRVENATILVILDAEICILQI